MDKTEIIKKKQRRLASFKLLFESEFLDASEISETGTEILEDTFMEQLLDAADGRLDQADREDMPEPTDLPEVSERVNDIIARLPQIDEAINAATEGWKTDRMGKVDLTLIRLAYYEMKYENVDAALAINEAVELAKRYGTDNSSSFVNGVLARLK